MKSKKEEKNGVKLENKFYSLREIISFEKKFLSDKIFLLSSQMFPEENKYVRFIVKGIMMEGV